MQSFQSEIRSVIMKNKIFFKGDVGLNLFAETGRVFTENLSSSYWHPSFGGGIWASFLEREIVFAISYAKSVDEHNIYLDMSMGF